MHLKESEASGKISGLEKKIQYAEIEKVTRKIKHAISFHFIVVVSFLLSSVLGMFMCLL